MKYNPERHHRRSIRLKGYDYARAGAYFVTIVTQDRAGLFGEVVDGEMRLNDAGRMILAVWDEIPLFYPGVDTDAFVIMPNHVHGIVVLVGATTGGCPDGGEPQGVAPTLSLPPGGNHGGLPRPDAVPDHVGATPRGRPHTAPTSQRARRQGNHGGVPRPDAVPDHVGATPRGRPHTAPTSQRARRQGNHGGVPRPDAVPDHVGATPRGRPHYGQARGPAIGQARGPAIGQARGPAIGQARGPAPTGLSLPDVVHRFKTLTTKRYADGVKRDGWPAFRGRLWQRNYYEHIIRNEASLNRIRQYILDNPARWALDRENPAATSPEAEDAWRT